MSFSIREKIEKAAVAQKKYILRESTSIPLPLAVVVAEPVMQMNPSAATLQAKERTRSHEDKAPEEGGLKRKLNKLKDKMAPLDTREPVHQSSCALVMELDEEEEAGSLETRGARYAPQSKLQKNSSLFLAKDHRQCREFISGSILPKDWQEMEKMSPAHLMGTIASGMCLAQMGVDTLMWEFEKSASDMLEIKKTQNELRLTVDKVHSLQKRNKLLSQDLSKCKADLSKSQAEVEKVHDLQERNKSLTENFSKCKADLSKSQVEVKTLSKELQVAKSQAVKEAQQMREQMELLKRRHLEELEAIRVQARDDYNQSTELKGRIFNAAADFYVYGFNLARELAQAQTSTELKIDLRVGIDELEKHGGVPGCEPIQPPVVASKRQTIEAPATDPYSSRVPAAGTTGGPTPEASQPDPALATQSDLAA